MIEDFFVLEAVLVALAGLCFGSFITLASYRLPLEEDIVRKPSRCPKCGTSLRFIDLWPVLSWLLNKGRCRYCTAEISARYPLIELATAALFLLVYGFFGITAQSVILMLLVVLLLVMIIADLEHYIIPDQVHLALLPLGIVYHYVMVSDPEPLAAGLVSGGLIGLALHYGYRHLRKKEGLGFGDVKFFAVAGLWLGFKPIVPFLFIAGLLGVVTGLGWRVLRRGEIFPFGPALAVALFICVAFPEVSKAFWNIGKILH